MSVQGDNPINDPQNDLLGRSRIAKAFAAQLLELGATEGLVVGVLGPWGSGKTSFVNLARPRLVEAGVAVLDFNPWMFSGAEQLVESFFIELAAQLKVKQGFAQIGKDLEEYGESFAGLGWLPLAGPWIERGRGVTKLLGKILQRRREGIGARRDALKQGLAALDRPLVVFLDDIDRLSTSEIRDTFKLVRLTASFPNIIYILAFDRARVEKALSQDGIAGRDYLEKILQFAIDLPAVPEAIMRTQVVTALQDALDDIENAGPFDDQVWPDVFVEVIWPLIRNMRDIRRYAVAVRGSITTLDGRVELVDVLALEAIRVFMPDVFGRLHSCVRGLTAPSGLVPGGDPPELKAQIDALLTCAGEHADVVRAMIERIFPAAL